MMGKTIIKIIVAVAMAVLATGCVKVWPRYVTRGGKVYFRDFSDASNPFVKANKEVVGADRRTFKVFKANHSSMEDEAETYYFLREKELAGNEYKVYQ